MNELMQALQRFENNASALARAIGVSADRVRVWKHRGHAPNPWPEILKNVKPKKGKK